MLRLVSTSISTRLSRCSIAFAPPPRLEIDDQKADQHQRPQQRQPHAEIPGQLARIAAVDPEQAGQGSPAERRRRSTNRSWTGSRPNSNFVVIDASASNAPTRRKSCRASFRSRAMPPDPKGWSCATRHGSCTTRRTICSTMSTIKRTSRNKSPRLRPWVSSSFKLYVRRHTRIRISRGQAGRPGRDR